MAVTTEITRVDFAKQADGSVAFCVEISQSAPDPFNSGQTITQVVDPRPMPPELALSKYGLSMSDIVENINNATAADLASANAKITELTDNLQDANNQITTLQSRLGIDDL